MFDLAEMRQAKIRIATRSGTHSRRDGVVSSSPMTPTRFWRRLCTGLKRGKIDALLAGGWVEYCLAALLIVFLGATRNTTLYFPGMRANKRRSPIIRALSTLVAKRGVLSTCDIETHRDYKALGIPIVFHNNYVPLAATAPTVAGGRGVDDRSIDVLLIGRFEEAKGQQAFISDLVAQVKHSDLRVHVGLVGSSANIPNAHRSECVRITNYGVCNREDTARLIGQSKIVVVYSSYEASPRVVAEAILAGAIVLSTPVGNTRYLMPFATCDRGPDFIDLITRLLDDPKSLDCLYSLERAAISNYLKGDADCEL